MTFLDELKKKSKCPVFEVSLITTSGTYYCPPTSGSSSKRCGDGKIEIKKEMSASEKIGTLAHELGHERCHRRRCQCYRNRDWVLVEVHAELYALHLLLHHQNRDGIIARFKRLCNAWCYGEYIEARDIIKSRRIYKRCLEFVK